VKFFLGALMIESFKVTGQRPRNPQRPRPQTARL